MVLCLPSDPKICTLTPNGHLDLAPSPNPLGLYPAERLTFALGSRKNSVSSLGRANLEQRALVVSVGCHWWWLYVYIWNGQNLGFYARTKLTQTTGSHVGRT